MINTIILSYVIVIYALLFPLALWGAFSSLFSANLCQQVALTMFALWSVWRISLVIDKGWGFPHEWLIATAMLLFALGTVQKTWLFRKEN